MKELSFELEILPTMQDVQDYTKKCEGRHRQQVAFSTYHQALTQICFDCKKIRTNIKFYELSKES